MYFSLHNQVATNTLERVAPLTHAVGNVLKRVFVIGFSIVIFGKYPSLLSYIRRMPCCYDEKTSMYTYVAGNKISTQTGIGTCIAIAGVAIYSFIKAKMEEEKRVSPKRNFVSLTRELLFQIYQNEYTLKENMCVKHLGSFDNWLELCSY